MYMYKIDSNFYSFHFSHNDLPHNLYKLLGNNLDQFDFTKNLSDDKLWGKHVCNTCTTDLPRLRKGKVGGQVSEKTINEKDRLSLEFPFLHMRCKIN